MDKPKRNRWKVFGVTLLWLIGARMVVALAFGVVVGFGAFSAHPHDAALVHQTGAALAKDLLPTFTMIGWVLRIAIVILARIGLLPGTGFPDQGQQIAAVFDDPAPVAARRTLSEPAPSTALPAARVAPAGFGRRRAQPGPIC